MKKTILCFGVISAIVFGVYSYAENERAKSYSDIMTIDLPSKSKLITATWKESELWYLYQSREDSKFDILPGKVTFNEK